MTKSEIASFREQLLSLGKRLIEDVSGLENETLRTTGGEASGNLSNTPVHMADLSADNFDQEISLKLLEKEEGRLEQVADALRRIEEGNFGQCENCQREISKDRLLALPFARLCIDCARNSPS